jgi:hypothetical protein
MLNNVTQKKNLLSAMPPVARIPHLVVNEVEVITMMDLIKQYLKIKIVKKTPIRVRMKIVQLEGENFFGSGDFAG